MPMQRWNLRRLDTLANGRVIAAALGLALTIGAGPGAVARAEPPPSVRHAVARDGSAAFGGEGRSRSESSGGWWLGTAGVAFALALCGWGSVASRKFLGRAPGPGASLRVVGRASLSPKHSVYLLDVGGRVLLVGTGPQGAPSLLGELTGEEDLDLASAARPAVAVPGRLDVRLGDAS